MKFILKQKGFSLVQTLVVMAIVSIVSLAVVGLFVNLYKQTRFIESKIANFDLNTSIRSYLSNAQYCTCLLKDSTYNKTNRQWANEPRNLPNSFLQNCSQDPAAGNILAFDQKIGTDMVVSKIQIEDTNEIIAGSYNYAAKLTYGFATTASSIVLKDNSVSFSFVVDKNTPDTALKILGCKNLETLSLACVPTNTTEQVCPTVANGRSLATCTNLGTWSNCEINCSTGYSLAGTAPNQRCDPGGGGGGSGPPPSGGGSCTSTGTCASCPASTINENYDYYSCSIPAASHGQTVSCSTNGKYPICNSYRPGYYQCNYYNWSGGPVTASTCAECAQSTSMQIYRTCNDGTWQ